jgi:predicted ArsR family transcriptional regulator
MPKKRTKTDSRYAQQGAVAAILKMLARPSGATIAEMAKARGLQPHSVRAVISRLRTRARVQIERTQVDGRGSVYRAPSK